MHGLHIYSQNLGFDLNLGLDQNQGFENKCANRAHIMEAGLHIYSQNLGFDQNLGFNVHGLHIYSKPRF